MNIKQEIIEMIETIDDDDLLEYLAGFIEMKIELQKRKAHD